MQICKICVITQKNISLIQLLHLFYGYFYSIEVNVRNAGVDLGFG